MAQSSPPLWLDPTYPPIQGIEAKNAVNDLMVSASNYPKIVRSQQDVPIPQQDYGLISWNLFKEPKTLPGGKNVYGFFKLRGNYPDVNMCKNRSAEIIRNQDSKNKILILPVGQWLPITEDEATVKENIEVDSSQSADPMKEAAIKTREDEEKRIMRELKEREEEVKNAKDLNDDPEHIDFYTMKRVTWSSLVTERDAMKKKLENIDKKIVIVRRLLYGLEKKFPEYSKLWIDVYNQERRKSGIPDLIPNAHHEKEYDEMVKDL